MRSSVRSSAARLLLVLVLAGCGGTPGGPASPTIAVTNTAPPTSAAPTVQATPAPTPRATGAPTASAAPSRSPAAVTTPSPSASPAPSASDSGGGLALGSLPAGTYQVTEFTPGFTITVTDGFTVRANRIDMFWLTTGSAPTAPEFAVIVPQGTYGVIKALEGSSTFKVGKPESVELGGLKGRAIDIEYPKPAAGATRAPSWMGALFNRASDGELWFVDPGRKVRLIELTHGDSSIVVTWDASTAAFAGFDATVQPMVDSIVFG